MFVSELSAPQRRALLVLARQVIDADRRLTLGEVERLDRLYAEAGLPPEGAGAPSAAGDLNLLFPDARTRAVVVLELLLVGYADGTLAAAEARAIGRIAAQLGLSADEHDRLVSWAARHAALMTEAREFGRRD
ncbi:MAG: TerB family tellurite resistance protein [Rubricoccaceae bacterium]